MPMRPTLPKLKFCRRQNLRLATSLVAILRKMKTGIIILISSISYLNSLSANIDSILFSTDGKYVLMLEEKHGKNSFELYDNGKNKVTAIVRIEKDSAFVDIYKELKEIRNLDSIADLFLKKQYLINEFLNKYKLTLKATLKNEVLSIKIDTIKAYIKRNTTFNYSSKYFDICVKFFISNQLVYSDTVSTNLHDNRICEKSDFKLYISQNNKFYFLSGWYSNQDYDGIGGTSSVGYRVGQIGLFEEIK